MKLIKDKYNYENSFRKMQRHIFWEKGKIQRKNKTKKRENKENMRKCINKYKEHYIQGARSAVEPSNRAK